MLNHNPVDWIETSSRLDSKVETPKLKIEESSRLDGDPSDWIRATPVLKKAQLCFKVLPTQGPLDPKCLGLEVRIREMKLRFLIGFRLYSLG